MRKQNLWAKPLNIPLPHFEEWTTLAPSDVSFTYWCLTTGRLPVKNYLSWARDHYALAAVEASYFQTVPNRELWSQIESVANWSPWMIPLEQWDGVVFIGCVEPPTDSQWSFPVAFVLADPSDLLNLWRQYQQNPEAVKKAKQRPPPEATAASPMPPPAAKSAPTLDIPPMPEAVKDAPILKDVMAAEPVLEIPTIPEALTPDVKAPPTPAAKVTPTLDIPPAALALQVTETLIIEAPPLKAKDKKSLGKDEPEVERSIITTAPAGLSLDAPIGIKLNLTPPTMPAAPSPKEGPVGVEAPLNLAPVATPKEPPINGPVGAEMPKVTAAMPVGPFGADVSDDPYGLVGMSEPPSSGTVILDIDIDEESPIAQMPVASEAAEPARAKIVEKTHPVKPEPVQPKVVAKTEPVKPEPVKPPPPPKKKTAANATPPPLEMVPPPTPKTAVKETAPAPAEKKKSAAASLSPAGPVDLALAPEQIEMADSQDACLAWFFRQMKQRFTSAMFFVHQRDGLMPWKWDTTLRLAGEPTPVSFESPSLFRVAARTLRSYHGFVVDNVVHNSFFKLWGFAKPPPHVTAVPVIINGAFAGLFLCVSNEINMSIDTLEFAEKIADKTIRQLEAIQSPFEKAA